ncbi:MAG: hypothetical protein ACLR23_05620 [Clostridia bacterium]
MTVKATSSANPAISGTKAVTVSLAGIANITPGSTDTVTLDGIEFYVLAKENDQALLLSKDILEKGTFGGTIAARLIVPDADWNLVESGTTDIFERYVAPKQTDFESVRGRNDDLYTRT